MSESMWAALFDAHILANAKYYFRLANKILRDGGDADDACQSAFLNAWERRNDLVEPAFLRSWLSKAVIRQSLVTIRKRVAAFESTNNRVDPDNAITPSPVIVDDGLRQLDRQEAIIRAIAKLPENQQMIVVLRSMQQLSIHDTAMIVGCSISAVSIQHHRGLSQLRVSLADWKFDPKE